MTAGSDVAFLEGLTRGSISMVLYSFFSLLKAGVSVYRGRWIPDESGIWRKIGKHGSFRRICEGARTASLSCELSFAVRSPPFVIEVSNDRISDMNNCTGTTGNACYTPFRVSF